MANAIFKRPVRLGNKIFNKSQFAQVVDDKFLQQRLMKFLIKLGDVVIIAPEKADDASAAKAAVKGAPAAK